MLSVVPSSVRSDDSFLLSDFETIEHENKTKQVFQTLVSEETEDPEDHLFILELLEMQLDDIKDNFGTTLKYRFIIGKHTLEKWKKHHITASPYVGWCLW